MDVSLTKSPMNSITSNGSYSRGLRVGNFIQRVFCFVSPHVFYGMSNGVGKFLMILLRMKLLLHMYYGNMCLGSDGNDY